MKVRACDLKPGDSFTRNGRTYVIQRVEVHRAGTVALYFSFGGYGATVRSDRVFDITRSK